MHKQNKSAFEDAIHTIDVNLENLLFKKIITVEEYKRLSDLNIELKKEIINNLYNE